MGKLAVERETDSCWPKPVDDDRALTEINTCILLDIISYWTGRLMSCQTI